MQWWQVIALGAFGGVAVEAVDILGAVKRTGQVPWNRPGEVSFGAFALSVAIRVLLGSGLAYLLWSTAQVTGPFGAFAIGVTAPLIVGELAKQVPVGILPVGGGAGGTTPATPAQPPPPAQPPSPAPSGGGAAAAPPVGAQATAPPGDGATVSGGGGVYWEADEYHSAGTGETPRSTDYRDRSPSLAEHPLGTQLALSLARTTKSFRASPR